MEPRLSSAREACGAKDLRKASETTTTISLMLNSTSDPKSSQGNQKRTHPHSISSAMEEIFDYKKNKSEGINAHNHKRANPKSRLQLLHDHNIIENVMMFLDEIALFQLENTHMNMIGQLLFARQWYYLSICDEKNMGFAHKRWRSLNAEDITVALDETESPINLERGNVTNENDHGKNAMLPDSLSSRELLARKVGRFFAEEAIFVQEREKDASRIYDFDRMPVKDSEIPLSMAHSSATDIDSSLATSCSSSSQENFWNEWYDYRMNSVNDRYVFVRLSLRDGTGRFWHGFRRLTTEHNRTFFRMHFDMKELIQDMQWTELESYVQAQDTGYTSAENRLKTAKSLMRTTQLTVSLEGKLLMATGGYSKCFTSSGTNNRSFFHSRNYRFPLSNTTKNEIQWKPYRTCFTANSAQNQLIVKFECDHTDLPFMRVEDIGNPNAHAHW